MYFTFLPISTISFSYSLSSFDIFSKTLSSTLPNNLLYSSSSSGNCFLITKNPPFFESQEESLLFDIQLIRGFSLIKYQRPQKHLMSLHARTVESLRHNRNYLKLIERRLGLHYQSLMRL